jgi:hypothetical protein
VSGNRWKFLLPVRIRTETGWSDFTGNDPGLGEFGLWRVAEQSGQYTRFAIVLAQRVPTPLFLDSSFSAYRAYRLAPDRSGA